MSLFLCLQGNTYHFRKAIPLPLQPYFGKREFKKTLKTGNKHEASHKAALLNSKVDKIISICSSVVDSNSYTEDNKKDIILDSYAEHFSNNFNKQNSTPINFQHTPISSPPITGLSAQDEFNFEKILLNAFVQNEYLAKIYDLLSRYINFKINTPTPSHSQSVLPSTVNELHIDKTASLKQIITEYTIDRESAGKWKAKTREENLACYDNFLDFAGRDITCSDIDYHLVRTYRDTLKKLPANRNKSPEFRNKSIQELLALKVNNPMSATTVNKNLSRLSSLFKFAVKLGKMTTNPAEGLEISVKKKASELRSVYTHDELQRLFTSDDYLNDSFKKSYMFWAIPIALFTGMRQTEIAQLYLDDIQNENGIWFIDVNDSAKDKKLKNLNSRRKIPLHDFLSKSLNLPAYVKSLQAKGQIRLFPELSHGRDGYGQTVSRWYNGYVTGAKRGYKRICGIKATKVAKKDFHSFRHTLIDHLKQKQVDPVLLHEFDGHSFGSMTMDRYGKEFRLETMYKKIVTQISFDKELDLEHLSRSQYVL